jgi:photosystem II stability/assembly factor-like uncharacterized protein
LVVTGREVVMRWSKWCVVAVVSSLALHGCAEGEQQGGYVWCEMALGSYENAVAVSFPDPLIGTYVGEIYRSTDGGMNWTRQQSPAGFGLYADVVFTDVDTGTIVGPDGTILRTTDGGESWVAQESGTEADLFGVSFADANDGIAVGANGTILRTSDGGATWDSQQSGTDVELRGGWLSSASTATAVGLEGTILRTFDGGATWVAQESGTDAQLNAVSFGGESTGVVVAEDGAILRTTNGGVSWADVSWTTVEDSSPLALNDVWFANRSVATIVGDSATILRTTNGGASWVPEINDAVYWTWSSGDPYSTRVDKNIEGVSMPDAEHGFAVGEKYCVLRRTTVDDKYDLCDSYCARLEECYPDEAVGCAIDCLCELRYAYNHSEECERAYADSWKCLLALSCEEIEAFFIDWSNHVCTAAAMNVDAVCGW